MDGLGFLAIRGGLPRAPAPDSFCRHGFLLQETFQSFAMILATSVLSRTGFF
jgi:hypothetical protein